MIKKIYYKLRKFNKKNITPLHYAAENNSKETGEILISEGADINAIDFIKQIIRKSNNLSSKFNLDNDTPLHYAIRNNSKDIIELIVSKNVDINIENLQFVNSMKHFFLRKLIKDQGN